jgi:hypothetical protein
MTATAAASASASASATATAATPTTKFILEWLYSQWFLGTGETTLLLLWEILTKTSDKISSLVNTTFT